MTFDPTKPCLCHPLTGMPGILPCPTHPRGLAAEWEEEMAKKKLKEEKEDSHK